MTPRPGSPLRGRYLVRNRGWNAALRATDAFLATFADAREPAMAREPRRILVAVGGHLGDAVIATAVLPVLAEAYPNAELGMLLPSWSRAVVEGHPRLRWLHHADHWKMSRAAAPLRERWTHYRETSARCVDEIRAVGYDAAVDLYAYYPNAARLVHAAGVPVRVGYASGGCGPLYTRALEWSPSGHTAEQHLRLVDALTDARRPSTESLRYDLPPLPPGAIDGAQVLTGRDYLVVHPGTGHHLKQWPTSQWKQLISALRAGGERIVITGAGAAERTLADEISGGAPEITNLVGAVDWTTFPAVVAGAGVVIGADSVAGHLAAAHGRPAIAIMSGISNPDFWRPLGDRAVALTQRVPCAPCFRSDGCAAMSCVRDVLVDDVLAALSKLTAKAHV